MPEIVSHIIDVYVYRITPKGPEHLLLRRSAERRLGGTWQAVRGHIKNAETAVQAAVRELEEETQLEVLTWHQLETPNAFYVARSDEIHLCASFAARVKQDTNPILNYEHDAFEWLDHNEAMNRVHWQGQKRALTEIAEVIIPGSPTADSLRISPS
jgi:dATP pyrophosphohydrolase